MDMIKQGQSLVIGTKQVLRAIESGTLLRVYVAQDADAHIKEKIVQGCDSNSIPVMPIESMAELGNLCGIEVASAAAGVVEENKTKQE